MIRKAIILLALMSGTLLVPAQSVAQNAALKNDPDQIDFTADTISYEAEADIVTASGDVRMVRNLDRVRADKIIWSRKTGQVRAEGNVAAVNATGDTVYGDVAILEDSLKDGVVENLLLVLADGARLAARSSTRVNDVTTLNDAAYSPCLVIDSDNCPRKPSWQISAVKIVHDPIRNEILFKGARLELFGVPLFVVPTLSQPLGTGGRSGFLIPALQFTRTNGLEIELPYYFKLKPNRDLTITPHLYSAALPAVEARYRALTENSAYQVSAFATYGSRIPTATLVASSQRAFRGYLDASGRFQLDPQWSVSGSIRRVTDRTFLRRYDISRDDRLRSTLKLERIAADSYFALTGWSIQTLRSGDPQGQIPIALPEVDFRKRFADPILGGRFDVQLNTLALGRSSGQDTQRAFAGARWDLRRLTTLGQEVLLTAYGRGDIYRSDENLLTTTALYRGKSGFQGRAIGAVAGEIRWPLIGAAFGGTQRITPRLQIVASPKTSNLDIPNEDARAVDLEDSNLSALNRFPGYDRWEDGTRLTYGLDYAFDAPGLAITANIGQSYRLTNINTLLPDGTGLNNQVSDIVGRATVKLRDIVNVSYRFRLDKDNFTPRRQEFDATIGNRSTYATLGYLRLNRNIGPALEDLRDREEIRVGGRVQIAKFISLFGSAVVDLTDRAEDPLSAADGYEPIRHRLGIAYTDECLDIGLTWRRDYDTTGDARAGNSYLLRLVFRGLGR